MNVRKIYGTYSPDFSEYLIQRERLSVMPKNKSSALIPAPTLKKKSAEKSMHRAKQLKYERESLFILETELMLFCRLSQRLFIIIEFKTDNCTCSSFLLGRFYNVLFNIKRHRVSENVNNIACILSLIG